MNQSQQSEEQKLLRNATTKMAVIPLSILLCLAAFYSTVSADLFSEYAHHAVLDPEEKMKLFWTIDWDAKTVSFAVEAETTGWVGFGFSTRSGQMVGSDVVIGWVKDNKGYLTDRYAEAKALPPMDEQQDYKLTGFQESDGKTLLKFKRKFDTCDSRDRKLEVGATKVVFAYHSEDPVSTSDMKHHEFRGARTILLLNSMDKRNMNETGWSKFNVTAKNVTIPAKQTTYWCSLLKGPALKSKHHITKIVPNIQKGNEGFVHHLILYECDGNFTEEHFDQGVKCSTRANMPYLKCRWSAIMVAAWAVGGEGIYFPLHVGYPIGESDSPTNFLLEMHYDNPKLVKDQQDSSGLTFYYTDNLRKYDAGVAAVGINSNSWLMIPPKQKNWLSIGYCMHQCSESLFKSTDLPGGGIKVFASGLHTHLAGRAAWTKHVRNGKELPEITRDDHYDFNFQDMQVLRKEITIRPGDDLIQYCKYDSMDRDQPIRGGESTREEMCLNFLLYYPRIKNFRFCTSTLHQPSLKLIDNYFHDVSISNYSGNPLVKMDIKWTDDMTNDLRKYQSKVDTVIPGCWLYSRNITSYEDVKFRVPTPEITEPLPPEKTCHISSGAVTPTSCVLFVGVLGVVMNALI